MRGSNPSSVPGRPILHRFSTLLCSWRPQTHPFHVSQQWWEQLPIKCKNNHMHIGRHANLFVHYG